MRSTVLAAILASAVAGSLRDRSYYEEKFFNWLQEHKVEVESGEHFVHMLANFAANDDLIETHNAANHSFQLGHNRFSHMNSEEWRSFVRRGYLGRPAAAQADYVLSAGDMSAIPTSIDWVAKGAVTGVKDQGQCGSCWSFSATGALEGAYKNKYGTLKSFSEQDLVDCDNFKNGGTDMGCNGGLMDNAFKWIKKNGGLPTEADYPYVSGTTKAAGTCDKTKDGKKDSRSTPTGFTDVKKNDENALLTALAQQPVSVAIEADQKEFQLYKSGVFTGTCGANLDHGVLAVGYDSQSFKVKNSWGASWGEGGYIRIARGSYNGGAGQCGILSGPPSYPNL